MFRWREQEEAGVYVYIVACTIGRHMMTGFAFVVSLHCHSTQSSLKLCVDNLFDC